jgi:ribosomal protein S18 acetylase RimI-like enzyme
MFVRPGARGTGFAAALLDHAVKHAGTVVEEVRLAVVASNPAAVRFYARAGFTRYGLERRALRVEGRYYDELLMRRSLDGP